jgi:ferredoxin-NADP reductase
VSSSALAIVTTIHLSMLVARQHRSRPAGGQAIILLPAVVLSVLVWVAPTAGWVFAGVGAHLAWFAWCEAQSPARDLQPAASTPSSRPSATIRPADPRPPAGRSSDPKTVPILAVLDETPDIKTFRMSRPDGFDFTAGQFLTVRIQVDGKTVQRAYSISSAPLARGYLEISVKRIGLVSSVLHSSIRPGAMVTVRPPAGTFVYPSGDDRPLVLVAGGIGITPLVSMLRHGVATEPSRPIALVYSVRTPDDLAFRDELAVISRRHPQVRIGIAVTQGPASDRWHRGRITASLVRAYASNLPHSLAYICGPQPMIDAMTALMGELGVPPPQIRSESFGAAMKLVAEADADARPPVEAAAAGAVVVRFARSGREAHVEREQTLLEAAEATGVDIPSVCRAGSCHTCRTRVTNGDVCCESDSLSDRERGEGFILPCVSRARSDCELEA